MHFCIRTNVLRSCKGQASVEAALLLPIIFVFFGIFLQPCFLLYDKCIMQSAAYDTARLASTLFTDHENLNLFAQRRLGLIPNADAFHVGGMESWEIEIINEGLSKVVTITNHVRALPLIGIGASLISDKDNDGNILLTTNAKVNLYPIWMENTDLNPQEWIASWK